jgi:glycosyltransferase involved in cell wall biosynthesis
MKRKKLKIAIFHLAFFYSGGGERLVLEEIKGLQKRGHQITCFTPVLEKRLCFPDIINDFPIKVLFPKLAKILPNQETMQIVITCLLFPLIARRFRKFDIVFGANQPGPWFGWCIKKLTKVPYIIYLAQPTRILYPRKIDHETGFWVKKKSSNYFPTLVKYTKPFIRWIDKLSIQSADAILVNGSYMCNRLAGVYKKEVINCPAGANPTVKITKNRWQGEIKANSHRIKKPYILITNRHFPQKKFGYAINAMPKVLEEIPGISLIITGNPTKYTKNLKEDLKKHSYGKAIHFTGLIKERDLIKLYLNAALYVYTAPEEDFGMGVIESMAAGVPVVAWNRGGPATTILNHQTGLLVKPYLQSEFTDKTIALLKDRKKNRQYGNNALSHVKRTYTYKKHIDLVEQNLIKIVTK